MQIKNEYHLELVEEKTGRVKQVVDCSNTVVNAVYDRMLAGDYAMLRGIAVGTGTGTPRATDTGLFSFLYGVDGDVTNERTFPTYKKTIKITIDAAVGNGVLTECAVGAINNNAIPSSWLATHALFTDAEGNPITINKTSLDILHITATIYFTLNTIDPVGEGTTTFLCKNESNSIYDLVAYEQALSSVYTYPIIQDFTSYVDARAKVTTFAPQTTVAVTAGAVSIPTRSIAYTRDNQWCNGKGYEVFGILLAGVGAFKITPEIFPPTPFGKYQIGVGDGVTKGFYIKSPSAIAGTQKVYVDGVLKTEGVDYTFYPILLGDFYHNYISTHNEFFLHMPEYTGGNGNGLPAYPVYSAGAGKSVGISSADHPIWDFKTPTAINCLVHPASANGITDYAVLQCSADNITWEDVIVIAYATYDKGMVLFTERVARYWKIAPRANFPGGWRNISSSSVTEPPLCFGYSVPNIQLVTAPAVGQVVEVEYDIARPFKNDKHNILFSGSFEYGR